MAATNPAKAAGDQVVIGIDLGTTYSCVAVALDGRIEIITNDQGNRTTPSFVGFDPAADYERLIGDAAKYKATVNPRHTVFDVKRLIGKKFHNPEVQTDINYLPYSVVDVDGKPHVELEVAAGETKLFRAEEISAMVLGKMKEAAESYLGKPVADAVVTVPAYFNDAQRQATKDAGKIAGLNVLRIVSEPTAAALAYGLFRDRGRKRKILVYDLGGGTFDVSILEIEDASFRVLATGGDSHLGGGDFDRRLIEYFVDLAKKKHKMDVGGNSRALGRLRKECERAKRVLSSQTQANIEVDSFYQGMDFSERLSRAKFEELNVDLFDRTMDVVKTVMEDAKLDKGGIDETVLVGGSTRIPKVREMLKELFDGKEPLKDINADEAVAMGAAALGANLGGVHAGAFSDIKMRDVTPLSLGIDKLGGLMGVVIPRNTPIPTKMSKVYITIYDQQTSIPIRVYQGERPLSEDCIMLGSFTVTGLTPAPRGVTRITVTFEVDEDGILTVTAVEKKKESSKGTTTAASVTIASCKGGLSEGEIQRMIREAREMEQKDRVANARVLARNELEKYIYEAKRALSDDSSCLIEKRKMEEALKWLDEHNYAATTEEEYKLKLKKLRSSALGKRLGI